MNQRSKRDHKVKRCQAQTPIHWLVLLSSISWIPHFQPGGLPWGGEAHPERSYGGQEMHFTASCIILKYLLVSHCVLKFFMHLLQSFQHHYKNRVPSVIQRHLCMAPADCWFSPVWC